MRKKQGGAVDSFEKLGTLIVGEIQDLREEMNERFESIDKHFINLEVEMRSGFDETKKILDRHDTRIAALEYSVFGTSDSQINNISKK